MFGLTDYVIVIVINALASEDKKPTNFFDEAATIRIAARNSIYRDTVGNQHARSDIQKQAYASKRVPTIREAFGLTGTNFGTHTPYLNGKLTNFDAEISKNSEVILIKNNLNIRQALLTAQKHRILPWRTEPSSGSEEQFETTADVIDAPDVVGGPPAASFAPDGQIISGSQHTITSRKDLINVSSYVLEHAITLLTVSATGVNNIFLEHDAPGAGRLLKSPCNSQLMDALQSNTKLEIDDSQLSIQDAGFEKSGLFGTGTYILGSDFSTTWSSIRPSARVRQDYWGDTIAFFNEPETDQGPFKILLMARLINSVLYDHADSVYANNLFRSGIDQGILVFEGTLTGDPMKAVEDGAIVCSNVGSITIGYFDNADLFYPQIVIQPIGTGTE